MKVIIFTETGSEIGLGHVSRCGSLYDELVSRGINVEMIIHGDNKNIGIIENKDYKVLNWLSEEFLNKYVTNENYCIVDSYLADEDLYQIISNRAQKSLFIDDNARIEYPKSLVVNPSLNTSRLYYTNDFNNEYLLGHKYIILRPPFIDVKRQITNEYMQNILVTMGGTDPNNLTLLVLDKLKSKDPDLTFDVIVGNGFVNIRKLLNLNYPNVKIHQNITAENMKDLMLNADIAITAAGQTIYELIATKTPFIPIKTAENQINNIEGLKKYKLVNTVIDFKNHLFLEQLDSEFNKMISYTERHSLIKNYSDMIDGLGVKRIIDYLIGGEK